MTGYTMTDQNPLGSNFFLPNYGMDPGASNPSNAYLNSTKTATPSTPDLSTITAPTTTPTVPGTTTSTSGLGMNTGTLGLLLGGIQTIGSLWQAWEANKLARQEFKFNKEFATENLENSVQSYNTVLSNHAEARGGYNGDSNREIKDYIRRNRLDKPNL